MSLTDDYGSLTESIFAEDPLDRDPELADPFEDFEEGVDPEWLRDGLVVASASPLAGAVVGVGG